MISVAEVLRTHGPRAIHAGPAGPSCRFVIDRAVRDFVRARAAGRCEYCRLEQALVPLVAFHLEHILARKHGGTDEPENLALACYHCNLDKGPNLTGIDPHTGVIVRLFHPRSESWDEHSAVDGAQIVGRTATGRATARVLDMNTPTRIELRTELGTRPARS